MPARIRDNAAVIVGVVISLIMHGIVLFPWLIAVASTDARASRDMQSTLSPEPPPVEDDLTLGLEAENPSTLTWVGYDEFREHIARLSEVEQADMTETPPTGATAQATPAQPLTVTAPMVMEEMPIETAGDAPTEPTAPAPLPIQLPETSGADVFLAPEQMDQPPAESTLATDAPADAREASPDAERDDAEAPAARAPDAVEVPDKVEPIETQVPEPSEQPAENQQESAPGEDMPPNDTTGDTTDRESDATAIIDLPPDKWKTGQPLAAHGLELKPRSKPAFTRLTLALPLGVANPLVEMRFDSRGVVVSAEIVRSSGRPDVDEAIFDWLFVWRASGEELKTLKEDETLPIVMRIILVERKR